MKFPKRRDDKFACPSGGHWGGQLGDREENRPKTLFFLGSAMTIKVWNCKLYCWEKLSSLRRLLEVSENFSEIRLKFLECRKWGFKRWGFKQIWGYLRKRAFFLRFLDFSGALRILRKRAKKAEKRAKKADFGRFPGQEARHPLNPHLLHPHLRQPKICPEISNSRVPNPPGANPLLAERAFRASDYRGLRCAGDMTGSCRHFQ